MEEFLKCWRTICVSLKSAKPFSSYEALGNFSRKFYFELKYLENGLADFSDTNMSFFSIFTALSYETNL